MKLLLITFCLVIICIASTTAVAQTPTNDPTRFQLGNQLVHIPPPDDFEEAASQFEVLRTRMTSTEAPDNDVLAVHLSHADCEKVRAGTGGPLNLYTKVSIRRVNRELDYSAQRFADLISNFRKSGSQLLDVNGPTMKSVIERLDKSLTEVNKQQTQVDLSQPVNLGEFDTRPNVLSVMLLMPFKTKVGDKVEIVPVLGALSYVRVKQRLLYVYTYSNYKSLSGVEALRDFTKQWVGKILAANN